MALTTLGFERDHSEGEGGSSGGTWSQVLGTAVDMGVAELVADSGRWGTFAWGEHVLVAPGYRIAGGSDEIQRNIIGERVLGLPREPRADTGPWRHVPR